MYIDDIDLAKQHLKAGTLPPDSTLNFGQQPLSDTSVALLMAGLTSAHAAPGTTIRFKGRKSLQYKSIQCLADALVSQTLQPALTLHISAENLGTYRAFALLVDAITSPACVPWLTVNFSGSIIKQASFDYLIRALDARQHDTRLWVNLDINERNTRHLILPKALEKTMPTRYTRVDAYHNLSDTQLAIVYKNNHYLTNLRDFERKLNFGLLPTGTMLDLSKHDIKQDLGLMLREHPYPRELSIEFGPHKLSDTFVASLMKGLMSAHSTPGTTLGFWGNQNLSRTGMYHLMEALQSKHLQPALTLYISAEALEQCRVFYVLVDIITSPSCVPWLTVDFHDSKVSPQAMAYLVKKLEEKNLPMGLNILIGKNGTTEQRHVIYRTCEQSNRAGLTHLEIATYTKETRVLCMQRTNETLRCISPENRNAVSSRISQHMNALNKVTKKKRIDALKQLLSMLADPKQKTQTIHEVLCAWEKLRTKKDGTSCADAISSTREKFSTFRNNKQTSTQELIAQLKQDYADPPRPALAAFSIDNTQVCTDPGPTSSDTTLVLG
jgi:hypothetical protein